MSPKGSTLHRVYSLTLMAGLVFFIGLCLRKTLSGSRAGSEDIHSDVGTAAHLCAVSFHNGLLSSAYRWLIQLDSEQSIIAPAIFWDVLPASHDIW